MNACNKCLENNWGFRKIENMIEATCKICDNIVEFEAKPDQEKMELGSACRKCGSEIVIREAKKKQVYSHYLYCIKCRTIYFSSDYLLEKEFEIN